MGLKAVDGKQDLGGRPRRLAGAEAADAMAAFLGLAMTIFGDIVSFVAVVAVLSVCYAWIRETFEAVCR